jgi:glycosyltransferase involved in cell wall biosynthesis
MKILVAHNCYRHRGGEDAAREAEVHLLREAGHQVVEFFRTNDEIRNYSLLQKVNLGWRAVWSANSHHHLLAFLRKEVPDVAHFHNTFPLVSPAAYYACAEAGVPVVQTLHNYRLLCPGANFLRDGRVCEECLGRSIAWPGIWHGCYQDSRPATAAVAVMLATHHGLRTWQRKVGVYIALTEFARRKHIKGGIPAERIVVKPNALGHDPKPRSGTGNHALYIGRLSEEKGVLLLLDAWSRLRTRIPLILIGDGPLGDKVEQEIARLKLTDVSLLGPLPHDRTMQLLHDARFLVFPSTCFEAFPMTILEAFACGVPVIASGHGAPAEIISDGRTGLHFAAGQSGQLAARTEWAWKHPKELEVMGCAARVEFEKKYQASANLENLIHVYERAMQMGNCPAAMAAST